MNTVLFLLIAVFGYSVEGIKIRAVRSRVIQYLPFNQNTHTKSQYLHWLTQNQRHPIYKNGRLIYSYVNPGGKRFNMFGGHGAYAGYLTNNRNMGQGYQYVHQNWPSSIIQGGSVKQNGLNLGHNRLIGQSMHQSWQNSANGNPVDISEDQSGINPEHRGHIQTAYQSWHNSPGERPVDNPLEQYGVNSGHRGDIALYQNWLNSASLHPNDAFVKPSGLNPGNIDQYPYESWQDSAGGRPIDVSVKQKGVLYPRHVGSSYQSLQDVDPESIFDLSADQTHQPEDQSWQNSGDLGEINFPTEQTVPNSAHDVPIDSVQQNVSNFGQNNYDMEHHDQNSENGGLDIVSLDQNEMNAEDNTEPKLPITGHDLTFTVDESKENWPNEAPVQNIAKDINNDENSPIGAVTDNYEISPDNGDIISVDKSKQNLVQVNNEEGVSPLSAVNDIDLVYPNNELTLLDHSKLNEADQMQDIEKDVHINNEEIDIPAKITTESDQTSPDNINNKGMLTNVETNEEEDSAPVSTVPQNDLIPTDDENVSSEGQNEFNDANRASLKQILNEIIINNAKNSGSVSLNENNPISVNKKLYSTYQTNEEQTPLPIHPDILISNPQQSPAPIYSYIFNPNQQQNPEHKTTWNQATTTPQRQPLNEVQPVNQQWIKNIASNISPQEVNSVYSSMCQNPATNVMSERERVYYGNQPTVNIRDLMEHIKTFGTHDTPQFIGRPNRIDYTNPNFNKEIYPYYKLANIDINNIPRSNYYVPTPYRAVPNEFNIQSGSLKPNEHPLPLFSIEANENKEAISKNPDSYIIYIKPDGVQQNVGTENLVPIFPQPVTSTVTKTPENTEYEKPKQLFRTIPKQYVYQVTKAFMPDLLRLYHSKCDNGYGEKLLNGFKTLIDSIQGEHCELSRGK